MKLLAVGSLVVLVLVHVVGLAMVVSQLSGVNAGLQAVNAEVAQLTQVIEDDRVVVSLQDVAIVMPNPYAVSAEAARPLLLRDQGLWATAKFVPVQSLESMWAGR